MQVIWRIGITIEITDMYTILSSYTDSFNNSVKAVLSMTPMGQDVLMKDDKAFMECLKRECEQGISQ